MKFLPYDGVSWITERPIPCDPRALDGFRERELPPLPRLPVVSDGFDGGVEIVAAYWRRTIGEGL